MHDQKLISIFIITNAQRQNSISLNKPSPMACEIEYFYILFLPLPIIQHKTRTPKHPLTVTDANLLFLLNYRATN